MARIVFTSGAYLGDVAPFVEPANRLAARGHEVTFVLPAGFAPLLGDEAFDVVPYPLDFSPSGMASDPVHDRLLRHPWANQVRLARYWMRRGFVDGPEIARDALLHALDGADVLVTHPTLGAASMPVAQHLGVPTVVGQLFPMMMPTSAWAPPTGTRSLDLRRPINRIAWTSFAWGSGPVMYDRAFNRHGRALGQEPLHGNSLLAWTRAERTVVLLSRHYFGPEPDDWPGWQLGGFSHWTGPRDQPVDPHVEAYLDGGDAPVLVCLGTSAAAGAATMFATIADGLGRASLRPLMLVGSASNLERLEGVPGTFEFAPVAAVVDRCAAAVVSGALGTLAAALTAGLPVVVLPQLFDQIWHGRRVEDLGVGIMVTRPDRVAAAVTRLLRDPGYRERARALAGSLRPEDGAGALVEAVESTI